MMSTSKIAAWIIKQALQESMKELENIETLWVAVQPDNALQVVQADIKRLTQENCALRTELDKAILRLASRPTTPPTIAPSLSNLTDSTSTSTNAPLTPAYKTGLRSVPPIKKENDKMEWGEE